MNYFAHGYRFLEDPYFLAGTAVPDWLGVVDRKVRTHRARALEFTDNADPLVARVAQGVVQHHRDDAWFHNTDAFHRLSWQLTSLCCTALPQDEGFRPSFLGHILVELLLDWVLIDIDSARLERYYATLESLDARTVERAISQIAGRPANGLAWFIERFCEVQFLRDYADDEKLVFRLNQVMQRVRLAPLPGSFCSLIRPARAIVREAAEELLDHSHFGDCRKVG